MKTRQSTNTKTRKSITTDTDAPVITLDNFDLSEIMDELHYGTDCVWAA